MNDPQNEPRTCPYCDQPRQDTFENRFRFECGTAVLKENGKTVKQGRECKLRVAYSKLLLLRMQDNTNINPLPLMRRTNMNFPPSDLCRCINDECQKRPYCLRTWMGNTDITTPYTAFPSWPVCGYYISTGEQYEEEE